jgi:hypothetical protein
MSLADSSYPLLDLSGRSRGSMHDRGAGRAQGWVMSASGAGQQAVSANGWNTRLFWLWILYNSIAIITALTAVFLLALLGSNVLHLSLANHHTLVALPVATLGAVLSGGVLGVLQWLVIQPLRPQ